MAASPLIDFFRRLLRKLFCTARSELYIAFFWQFLESPSILARFQIHNQYLHLSIVQPFWWHLEYHPYPLLIWFSQHCASKPVRTFISSATGMPWHKYDVDVDALTVSTTATIAFELSPIQPLWSSSLSCWGSILGRKLDIPTKPLRSSHGHDLHSETTSGQGKSTAVLPHTCTAYAHKLHMRQTTDLSV